ncbi:MAG: hypothetical protein NZ959_05700 [Armatimonadetes bacterium]|nr:hypothetical protein [Armatimonadota bacterium]MDW8122420.1 hypothetical protein [Armatimonadota bacterium]
MRAVTYVAFLIVGFALGVFATGSVRTAQPPSIEEVVKKVEQELDESGRHMVTEVWALIATLKDAVKEAPVPIAPMPHMEEKLKKGLGRVLTAAEVLATVAFISVFEKTVVANPQADWFVRDRVSQFFKISSTDLESLRKEMTWSSIIVGLGIAKASGKDRETVLSEYRKTKAWAKVALDLGVPPEGLKKALEGLFPN